MGGGAEKSHNFIVSWQYLKIIFIRGREHMQAPSGKERGCLWHLSQEIAGAGVGEARRTGRKSKVLQDATSSVPVILLMTTGSRK